MTAGGIRKVLVANRGEIACRVMRTLGNLGIRSVAVYSDADHDALHVGQADEAAHLGAAPAAESYLRIDRVIAAAKATGADAIHPGYGFLSENPAFVRACADAGITFIGPDAEAIEVMGRKDAAKQLMEQAGVPVVPGYHGGNQDASFLAGEAEAVGYPVLIKARAGGGGKGMRLVERSEDFPEALESARREARAGFGDDQVLIEKFIPSPRHIEIQVFGDRSGNVVHLFERDCSVQRRHQKVIEEAPAPGMTDAMRQAMGASAVQAAKAVGYVGAGTVEFIVDGSGGLRPDRFWFMEMNTRLQVEHPVTEAVTGQDLVAWQIAVAEGGTLPTTQDQLGIRGHAFEARLYAEDTGRDFLPSTGTLAVLDLDSAARVDTGVRQGDRITPWYDPMIAKLIVHGPDRMTALGRLQAALEESFVAGCTTNLRFLARLCALERFRAGDVDTGLIARESEALNAAAAPPPEIVAAAAMIVSRPAKSGGRTGPWDHAGYWRAWGGAELAVSLDGQEVRLAMRADGGADARTGGWEGHCRWTGPDDGCLVINGCVTTLRHHLDGHELLVASGGNEWVLTVDDPGAMAEEGGDRGDRVTAPMPGLVTRVAVEAGEAVGEKQLLAVMEAMKMEHAMRAPRDGVISRVHVRQGDQVESGTLLLELEPGTQTEP